MACGPDYPAKDSGRISPKRSAETANTQERLPGNPGSLLRSVKTVRRQKLNFAPRNQLRGSDGP